MRITFSGQAVDAAARAVAGDKAEIFAAQRPFTIRLTKDKDPRRQGGTLAALLAGCPSPLSVELGLTARHAASFAQGLALMAYRPSQDYRSAPDDDSPLPLPDDVIIRTDDPDLARTLFEPLSHVVAGTIWARDLVAMPGNHLGPAELVRQAESLGGWGVAVEVLDPATHGLALLEAVGHASAQRPALVVLRWQGGGAERPLVLAGKGITFDTGGLSIKPAGGMQEMKGDMGGAAAVLGAMRAIAGRKAQVNVVGILAVAENMPGAAATRPGDVVRAYDGTTVEIVDTDAEGRLVLADALAWACAKLRPRLLVDAATLTGSVVTALGRHHAGLFANRDGVARSLLRAGQQEDEPLWRLPLSSAFDEDLKSDLADLRNCGWGRVPDANDAARFLQHFVDPKVAWAHLDIAGVSECEEPAFLSPKGATGFGVRLFDRLAAG